LPEPVLLVQLSDCHIGASWGAAEPESRLAGVVRAVAAMDPAPEAILLSGDLADHAAEAEYQRLAALIADLPPPVHVMAGNHDDRDSLRRHFHAPGETGTPLQYSVDVGTWRVVVLDSQWPGHDGGQFGAERQSWLERELGAAPEPPTMLAIHHPPVATGLPAFDAIGLPDDDRRALGQIVSRHAQVRAVVTGHVHRTFTGALAGRPVLSVPSTYLQARLHFRSGDLEICGHSARLRSSRADRRRARVALRVPRPRMIMTEQMRTEVGRICP
jgi:3',5'-cyclic AMP phosphodiesterase CpdA